MHLTRVCPNCRKVTVVEVAEIDFRRWQNGVHIQNVWPDKTPTERELIKTGFCSDKCWNEYLGPEE